MGIHHDIADGRKRHIIGACNIAIGLRTNNGNGALHYNITASLKGNSINTPIRTTSNRGYKRRSITINKHILKDTVGTLTQRTNRNTTGVSKG